MTVGLLVMISISSTALFILILLNYLQKIRNLYERILIVEEIQRKQGMQGSPK